MESFYLTIILGLDLQGMMEIGQNLAQHEDIARKCRVLEPKIKDYQDSLTAIEKVSHYLRGIVIYSLQITHNPLRITYFVCFLYKCNNDAKLIDSAQNL